MGEPHYWIKGQKSRKQQRKRRCTAPGPSSAEQTGVHPNHNTGIQNQNDLSNSSRCYQVSPSTDQGDLSLDTETLGMKFQNPKSHITFLGEISHQYESQQQWSETKTS